MITYEQQLDRDRWWALQEGSRHFERNNLVHAALAKITRDLEAAGIPYAVAGALAMFFHGYRRFSEYLEILIAPEGFNQLLRLRDELGYLVERPGARSLRVVDSGVCIKFLIAGTDVGAGKPEAMVIPPPESVGVVVAGVRCVSLPALIELFLVSGMSHPSRRQNLADVQRMIDILELPQSFAENFHPSVRDMYQTLWREVENAPRGPDE
jgi:hypothetical protein